MVALKIEVLPEPGNRYQLGDVLGTGVCAKVYKAVDTQANNKVVAIKIQKYESDLKNQIEEEYRVLRDFSTHPNLPDFYGVYCKKATNEIWFVLEYCEGGPIIDLIKRLHASNKRISEEHLAFILRDVAKAVVFLHKNHIIHRDIKGNNILITGNGEVKLCDFGLSRDIKSTLGKRGSCVGSPCWMAPEIVTSTKSDRDAYGNRSDVWAYGITAIELGDGKAPFVDMHPTRAMFQIVRNPPPTLYRQSNWTQEFNDFIAECLEKNQENRPFMMELLEHPFLTQLPENDYHLQQELKMMINDVKSLAAPQREEVAICKGYLKMYEQSPEKMYVEDLAAIERLSEDSILDEIRNRLKSGDSYSFIGDVLLSVNPNETVPDYNRNFHNKYISKSRSENAPHIFAVADSAYQDMLHHEEPQHVIMSGESYSGKTTNLRLCIKHFTFLGEGNNGVACRVTAALNAIHSISNAGTPLNPDSTRCILQTQATFGPTGKLTGAIFWVYLLEKLRVSTTNMNQQNFHIFYYFYDTMEAEERLKDFHLEGGRSHRYLRVPETNVKSNLKYCRDNPSDNVGKFKEFERNLLELDFPQDSIDSINKILAAILLLGEVRYKNCENSAIASELENPETAAKVANLLDVDEKKFQWALLNYCIVAQGTAQRRRHTPDEARDARDVLASTIYFRLVDWIVNTINQKLAFGRAIFGDQHSITLIDLFGFECFVRNHIDQLLVNSVNEQMQYHYNQRMFAWEMLEQEEEQVPVISLHFYDNKTCVDHLMNKPKGIFEMFDDASRGRHGSSSLTDAIAEKKSSYIKRASGHEFSIAHYTGKVIYDARDIVDKNRDFLPPEMVETMRTSGEAIVKTMFINQLSRTGNLTMADENDTAVTTQTTRKKKWGAALVAEKKKTKKINTLSKGEYSQVHKMRTLSSVFRATCLELLKSLSIGTNSGGTHFVRCMRADLEFKPRSMQDDMIRQQMRAMAILDTAKARQKGFPHRIAFQEFLRRYKFLAFDFDENVEITKDNCRLLLIRLKMEGWVIGKSKVFLKYYNVEYLSRLYETQVKKIIKVQSMMRAFLAKKCMATKVKKFQRESIRKMQKQPSEMDKEKASVLIQTAYRGYAARKKYSPLINNKTGELELETAQFIRCFAAKWKNKSIYQVLLQYRAARYLDLVNFSQQIHIYNQRMVAGLNASSHCILMDRIDPNEKSKTLLGPMKLCVWKLPFRLDEIPFFDTTYMCDPSSLDITYTRGGNDSDQEAWDAPLRRRKNVSSEITGHQNNRRSSMDYLGNESYISPDAEVIVYSPFCRDPSLPITKIAPRRSIDVTASPAKNIYSPIPYSNSRASVHDVRDRFGENNYNSMGSNKAAVYKKRAAPRTPEVPPIYADLEKKSSLKKRPAPQPRKFDGIPSGSVNPIRELELMGKKGAEENLSDGDDPPFNFQGMLRKTKYNRASMKRTPDGKMSLFSDDTNNNRDFDIPRQISPTPSKTSIRIRTPDEEFVETSNNYSHVVYHSKVTPERRRSPVSNKMKDFNHNSMELAPGILVDEDFCADL